MCMALLMSVSGMLTFPAVAAIKANNVADSEQGTRDGVEEEGGRSEIGAAI